MQKSIKITRRNSTTGKATKRMRAVDGGAISYLSKEQVEAFFAAIPETNLRDRLLFHLVYSYGLRRKEVAMLKIEHLVGDRIWITRVKRGVPGAYPISTETHRLIAAHLAARNDSGSPYLFASRQKANTPISTSTIYHAFREYAVAANLPPSHRHVHTLRHSIAVHWMDGGADIADCQDLLGHRHLSSTAIYARITNKRREEMFHRVRSSGEIAATT